MNQDARDLAEIRRVRLEAQPSSQRPPPEQPSGAGEQRCAHEAFARVYDRHAAVVRAVCRTHSAGEADADDALQETFLRAFSMLDRVDDPSGLRTWLYAIARRVCAERRRAADRRVHHEHASTVVGTTRGPRMQQTQMDSDSDAVGSPPLSADRSEQLERLTAALGQLPEDERLAIHLYYLESDAAVAAAECLGVSRSGFYKLLTRGRERLASMLLARAQG